MLMLIIRAIAVVSLVWSGTIVLAGLMRGRELPLLNLVWFAISVATVLATIGCL